MITFTWPDPAPVLLLTREVAELFEVDETTVRKWAVKGDLPEVYTPGGSPRYKRAAVEALFLAKHGAGATS